MQGIFINVKHYDFENSNGERVTGQHINCLVDDDIVKVSATPDEIDMLIDNGCEFGSEIPLDVRVKGKYAKYILAK